MFKNWYKLFLILTMTSFLTAADLTSQDCTYGQIAHLKRLNLWHETFGKPTNPALLLIMGGFSQGILWPVEFCEQLATAGFYVIRYDNRDTGFSTHFNFEHSSYDLLDMAQDAVDLLDFLKVKNAHIFGISMGGPIAELIAAYFPEKVRTLNLMATSCDFCPLIRSLSSVPTEEKDEGLSSPTEEYIISISTFLNFPANTLEEKLELRLNSWRICNGSTFPLEETSLREIHKEHLIRSQNMPNNENHILAIKKSQSLIRSVPFQVKVPTVIFHGSEDPIFQLDHGAALAQAIPHAKYVFVKGMGHVPNPYFYDLFVDELSKLAGITSKN